MQGHRKLTTICCAAVLSLALAACGGGNGDDQTMVTPPPEPPPPPPPPMVYPTALPDGHGLNPGMTVIPAGTTSMLPSGTYITCAGAEDCTLTISIESVTGALSASSMGGMVSVSTEATRLAALHEMNQQTLVDARAALAALDAMDPGDVTANQRAAAEMALANALALPGNEDAPENQPDPTPPPPPVASVTIPDGMYLDDDNAPSADSMTIPAGESATNNGVVFSCPADGDACEVEVAADGSVTSTGGVATAALSADAMTQVAQAKQDAQEEADRLALENRDRIIGKDRALEAAANIGTGGGPAEAAIIINRGGSGPATVTSAGYSMSDDPALPNGDVWIGSHLTQAVAGVGTNHLFVYTDKEPATRIQFYNWDGDATTPSLYASTTADALTAPADSTTTIDPLTLTPGGNFSARTADLTRFPAPQDPEEGSLTQNYRNNEDTDNNVANGLEQVSLPGNFNGAGGRYVCTGGTAAAPCSVTVAPGGAYTAVGTWTFVPELGSTAWIQDGGTFNGGGTATQRGEFMSFGWWLQEPTAQTGAYTFRYYADGTPYNLGAGNLAVGSATYTGRAAGKFVVQEIDNTGVVDGEAGMFTAAASLTARFNATGAQGTLDGVINGFQSDNADVDVSGWSVTLARQTLTDTTGTSVTSAGANNDPTSAGFDGATATMGDQTAHGTWTSQFFGQPATADAYPLGVGGTFQADNESASIAGAFGARRP